MPTDRVSYPIPRKVHMRALLQMIDIAVKYKDNALLDAAMDLVDTIECEDKSDMRTVISGTRNEISDEACHEMYCCPDKEAVVQARQSLERMAYGDFNEALAVLERDLYDASYVDKYESQAFRPELFNKEEQALWRELSAPLNPPDGEAIDTTETSARRMVEKLREYQQRVYGELIPTMTLTYAKSENGNTEGVGVRIAWHDNERLVVDLHKAELAEDLDNYFIYTNPIKSLADFNDQHVPQELGEYTLHSIDHARLFLHEL